MSLSEKSDEELSDLLTEYGIKHGPIVGSTRGLYEKKLEKVMESASEKPSSDRTYYREEEEEVTYITYHHSPVRNEAFGDSLRQRREADTEEDEESEQEEEEEEKEEPAIQVTRRAANHSAVLSKEPVKKSGGCMWRFCRLLLLLGVLAGAYYVYSQVVIEQEEEGKPAGVQ